MGILVRTDGLPYAAVAETWHIRPNSRTAHRIANSKIPPGYLPRYMVCIQPRLVASSGPEYHRILHKPMAGYG